MKNEKKTRQDRSKSNDNFHKADAMLKAMSYDNYWVKDCVHLNIMSECEAGRLIYREGCLKNRYGQDILK